ncbi:hypothetical protein [Leptospira adleri]|uniref:Lipoprotein n=1 Tax=Leptospira adleri TaxID=2023186 RepID=A0ABX4NVC6_9LEPT|nr:hypothetical protein [Leptospira adleri]PJZ60808.1 hypothetical protein CH376_16600 [Leptospira adleri]
MKIINDYFKVFALLFITNSCGVVPIVSTDVIPMPKFITSVDTYEYVPLQNVQNSFVIVKVRDKEWNVNGKIVPVQVAYLLYSMISNSFFESLLNNGISIFPVPYRKQESFYVTQTSRMLWENSKAKEFNFYESATAVTGCYNLFPFPVGEHYLKLNLRHDKFKMFDSYKKEYRLEVKENESVIIEIDFEKKIDEIKKIATPTNLLNSLCNE